MTFIERFLYHVLPKHFHRIRYYGFLANGKAKANIKSIRQDLAAKSIQDIQPQEVEDIGMVCPSCNKGTMMTLLIIDGYGNILADNLPDETEPTDLVAVLADTT
jgi:hypothetical protein